MNSLLSKRITSSRKPTEKAESALYMLYCERALERVFSRAGSLTPWTNPTMWTSCFSSDGKTRYGSYKKVSKGALKERVYHIELFDGEVSILYTDCVYDEKLHKVVLNRK